MTRIKQITEKVNNTPLIKDWKDKLYSKIDYDKRSCGYAPTQDTVITYATDMIFDYHDKIHNPQFRKLSKVIVLVSDFVA